MKKVIIINNNRINIIIVSRNRFEFINIIGRGGFGKVWKVLDKKFKKFYALKEISKVKVIDKKSINSIIYERELLSRLKHPLIINLHYAFQDYNNLYLVLDLLTGGDLRYQIGHHQRQYFSEQQTKFFISCIVESLSYIHNQNIIHRDIKPENLVFDDKGYLHITDFGIAKFKMKNNKNETSGTPGYMAPEVMKSLNHTGSVDYFAVGVITYELMMGQRPYIGKNRKEIKEQMMSRQIFIDEEMIPLGWSEESADFINRLMERKDNKRLGYYNELEIKKHPWFFDIDFDELVNKRLNAPFLPKINHDNYDKKYCEEIEKVGYETNYRYEEYKVNEHYKDIFYGFTFYNVDETQFQIYKKPNIKYTQKIQNQKYRIKDNLKSNESKTINIDNSEKFNKIKKDIVVIRKKRTIDVDDKNKNLNIDNNTIDFDNENNDNDNDNDNDNENDNENDYKYNENRSNKSINILHQKSHNNNGKFKKNFVTNIHKRIKSNLIGHNYIFYLQKKKLLDNKINSFNNLSNNDSTSINNKKNKKRKNHSINYKNNININKKDKYIHGHANSFSNNLYINLLNKIREDKNINNYNEDYSENNIDNKIYIDKRYKKRTIELNQIPRLIKINNNYNSVKNIKNKSDIFSSIDNNDSISSNNNDISQKMDKIEKIDMMKASSNFYIRQKIPHNKSNKITPINLRNKKLLLKTNYKSNNNYLIKNNETIINQRRPHIKVRTKSFSGKNNLDSNGKKNIINIISSEEKSFEKKDSYISKNKNNNNNNIYKNIFLNNDKKLIKGGEIRHNYSYSSFNNKNKIESLIKNIIEPEKSKITIPVNYKKSSNTLINTKVSTLHKKIPIPSSFGQKIFHKRMNGYMTKKLGVRNNNSFSTSINNNSISSISKNVISNNTSVNKSLRKEENNNSNINIKNVNNTINANSKKNKKPILNKSSNFNYILKKLNDFSKNHKSNVSLVESNNKDNKSKKFTVKNNLLNQIKKIGEKKNQIEKGERLKNINKKEEIEIKKNYSNILNNNIVQNKKFSNCNHKNKYNNNKDNKGFKNSIGNFSYPSYNSTTSSGGKFNNK